MTYKKTNKNMIIPSSTVFLLKMHNYNGSSRLIIIQIDYYLTATMYALLSDPQTIPFIEIGNINLHSLKREIDRRITKIKALVMGELTLPSRPMQTNQIAIQTDNPRGETSNNVKLRHRRVLSSHDGNIPLESGSFCQERPSLPNRKKTNHKQNQGVQRDNYNVRIRVNDYLTSKKTLVQIPIFVNSPSASREDDEDVVKSQEDKIFNTLQFKVHKSFKNFQSLKEISPKFHIPFTRNPTNESLASCEDSDNEGTEGRKSFSTVARKLTSVRKTKFTERTALSDTVRIIVSDECIRKMEQQLQKIILRKRREPADNKLRANVIKKVEEKYGEYYDHL